MQRNTLIVLILLALGLGAYVYFYEIRGQEERDAAKDAEKQLYQVKAADVSSLKVVNPHGTFSFARDKDQWSLTAPLAAPAETRAVEDVIFGIDAIRYSKIIEEKPADLTPFGLATPQMSVSYTTKDGEKSLLVGDDSPFGGEIYIMRGGDPRVYLTSYPIKSRLEKDLVGWRDKKLLDFTVADVQHLSVQSPGFAGLEAVRDGDAWYSAGEPRLRLDSTQLETMLYDIQALAAASFTGQTEPGLFGLVAPSLTVTLEIGKDKTRKQLLFGLPYGEEGRLPVVRQPGEEVRLVDAAFKGKVLKPPSELRDKRLAAVDRFKIDKLEASADGQTLTAAKDKESWKLEGTLKDKVKPTDVEAILDDVTGLKAEQILDSVLEADLPKYGLDKPTLELSLHQGEPAREVKLHFAHGTAEGSEKTYARADGDPSIYVLTKLVLDDMRDVLLKQKKDTSAGAGTGMPAAGGAPEGALPATGGAPEGALPPTGELLPPPAPAPAPAETAP